MLPHLGVGDDVREGGGGEGALPGVVEELSEDGDLLQLDAVLLLARVDVLDLREGVRADGAVEEVLEALPQHVRDRRAALAELLQRRDHVEHQPRAAHLDVAVLQRGHLFKYC